MSFLIDLRLLLWSLRHNCRNAPVNNYWQHGPTEQLDKLILRLSNVDTPERKLKSKLLKSLSQFSLLDAGCGPGADLTSFKNNGIKVNYTGIDGSEIMLNAARKQHPGVNFIKGDVKALPYPNNYFDVVMLSHVLEHLSDYQPAVSEAIRTASFAVVIDFFRRPLPIVPFDIKIKYPNGYFENWYSQPRFEGFLKSQPIRSVKKYKTKGIQGQTAVIYYIEKSVLS